MPLVIAILWYEEKYQNEEEDRDEDYVNYYSDAEAQEPTENSKEPAEYAIGSYMGAGGRNFDLAAIFEAHVIILFLVH